MERRRERQQEKFKRKNQKEGKLYEITKIFSFFIKIKYNFRA